MMLIWFRINEKRLLEENLYLVKAVIYELFGADFSSYLKILFKFDDSYKCSEIILPKSKTNIRKDWRIR